MTLRFAVVHEASADVRTATDLADRVLVEAIDWLDEGSLAYQRQWLSESADRKRLTWTGMKQLANDAGIKVHGHFDGEPGLPDAAAARRAIHYLARTMPEIDAILLIRDQDDQPNRKNGLEQARNQNRLGTVIVIGFAIVERECWVLSGFEPLDEIESSRLEEERKNLGFDPRSRSCGLTACKDDNSVKSPKRVLKVLTGDDRDRERRCWQETSLQILRERGGENGLEAYLIEVVDRLGPLIGHTKLHAP